MKERDTQHLSNDVRRLMNSSLELSYDTEAKNLFANKEVLSVIAKNVVTEVKEYSYEEIAGMIGNVSISKGEVAVNGAIERLDSESNYVGEKRIAYDIKTTISGAIDLIINLEIQREPKPGYNIKMRGSYYTARLFSEQLKDISEEGSYTRLKKVYSIWIIVNSPKECIERYAFMNMDTKEIDPENDPFHLVMIYLGNQLPKDELVKYIRALLERDIEYLKNYYVINEEMERSMYHMCNLGEGIKEEGIKEGIKEGKERREEEIVLNMLKEGLEMEMISKLTGMDLEVVKRISNKC